MKTRLPALTISFAAVLLFVANPSLVYANYTSAVVGSTATMVGDAASDTLEITQSGGFFSHNRAGDGGFNSALDFDSTDAGDQMVSSATGVINIDAGDGGDSIILGDGVDLRGTIDGGGGTDVLDYSAFTTGVRVNLGLGTTGLSATLGGDQEVPATPHAGTGTATVSNYDPATRTFDVSVTVSDLLPGDVNGFHIHQERVGANGPIIVNFPIGPALVPSGTGFTFNATGLVLPDLSEAAFLGGGTYVNIHTGSLPGGAIRGQLFSSDNATLAGGFATGTTGVLNVENVTGGLGGDSLVGNINVNTINGGDGDDAILGGPGNDPLGGDAGDDVVMWNVGDGSDPIAGGADADSVQVNGSLTDGDAFFVGEFPSGTAVALTHIPSFKNLIINTVETVTVNSLGGADGLFVTTLVGTALTTLNLNGFDGDDAVTYDPLFVAGLAFNINGGPGRDQLDVNPDTITPISFNLGLSTGGLSAMLSGDDENPPTAHTGTGTATVTNYDVATRTFDIQVTVADLPPADVTGFHIHQGLADSNGSIIVDFTGVAPLVPSGTGFTFTATGLTLPSLSEAAFLGGGTYVNIHTAAFGAGAIRGQLVPSSDVAVTTQMATGAAIVAGFELATGGAGDDSLVGGVGDNQMVGGLGADWLFGGPGADNLIGEAGADVLISSVRLNSGNVSADGGDDSDTVQVNGSASGDQLKISGSDVFRTNLGGYVLGFFSTETLVVNGLGGDDTLTVESNLTGGGSLTTLHLHGAAGNDVFNVKSFAAITPSVRGGAGGDTLSYDPQFRTTSGDLTPPDGQIDSPTVQSVAFRQTETVTIIEPQPEINLSNATVSEASAPIDAVFIVSLTQAFSQTVTVNFQTVSFTATQPDDYEFRAGLVTFLPGVTSVEIPVPILADDLVEGTETFYVTLHTPTNGTVADGQGDGTILDNAVPTISAIANQTIEEDTATGALGISVSDAETPSANLTLSVSSTNLSLVPLANIALGGSAGNRTVNVTPAENLSGSATIAVTVSDGIMSASTTFTVTVDAIGDPPTITSIANQTIAEDTPTAALALTISDVETEAATLTLLGESTDTTLVPNANIVFGGSGATRTVTVTPAANRSGSANITVTVSDGTMSAPTTFTVTVDAINDPPTITSIPNQTIAEDTPTAALVLTISDVETEAATLTLMGESTDTTLVPNANIAFGGSGATRTVTVTPAANANGGPITINVTVSDGVNSSTGSFTLTVTPVNDPPTITNIGNQTIAEDTPTAPLAFTISDLETPAASLTLTGQSTDPTLVPNANIVFGGSGATRTVTVIPAANRSGGPITIAVTVGDGVDSRTSAFTLTVTPAPTEPPEPPPPPPAPNQAPLLSGLADATTLESTPLTLSLAIGDDSTPAASLVVTASSSNTALVPSSAVVLGGADSTRTLTLTPIAEATGQTTVTVSVSDGDLTTTRTAALTVTVAPPPLAPTGLVGSALGTDVTLTWIEPTTGATPTFYVLEGGTTPGLTTLPVIVTPTRVAQWTVKLPAGVYFFRVRAANRAGTSARSNEAQVIVTSAVPLAGAPTGLAAIVEGLQVTLGWQPSASGGPPSSWQLELGSAADAIDRGVFPVPPDVTRVAGGLAAGEYFARVRGVNAAGPGQASNEARFRVGEIPACDAPQPPVLLPATVNGRFVTLAWRAPGNAAVGAYRLLVGSVPGASDLATLDLGPVTSFVATAPPGVYHVTVIATNACGTSAPSNPIVVSVGVLDPPADLAASVSGNQVALSWSPVAGAASYLLEAGNAPGLSNVGAVPVTAPGLTVTGVPSGTYYVRVRAVSGAGATSPPSAEMVVIVP